MIQKSYEENKYGKLYLVPTPIGNLDDMTYRGVETLKFVDIVFAEDTRETLNLLKHLGISKRVESCHKFTEMKNKDKILNILKEGKNIAYVTDRGTPLISDPGNVIVEEVIKEKLTVISLPGANALLPAINMSGISNEKFLFYGFLNQKQTLAKKELIELKDFNKTIIFYESPHRIKATLELLLEVFGDRNIAIAREITKLHEEVRRNKISEIIKDVDKIIGEIVIIVEGCKEIINNINYENEVEELLKKGYSKRDAIKEIADRYNISKNKLYEICKEK